MSTPLTTSVPSSRGPVMTASALGMFSYAACSTATPICLVMVTRDLGLSLTQASGLEIARSLPLTVMLVAAVFAAGWLGKARSLYFGMLAMCAGLVAYAYAPTYATLLAALALAGLGGGLAEALINPLVQDASRGDSGRWLNLVNGFWSVGVLVTALGGGEWLERGGSWRLLMIAIAILGLASALLFHRVRRSAQPTPRRRAGEVWGQTRSFLRRRRFWRFAAMMTCAGGAEGAYTFWSASLVQLEMDGTARAGGIATGAFALGMIVGRLAAGIWVKQHQLARLLLACAVAGVGVGALLPWLGHLGALVAGLFVTGLLVACFWPSLQAHAADRLPGDTTVLFVLLSLGGIPGFAAAVGLMGLVADHYSLRLAFGLVPAAFLGLALLLWSETRRGDGYPHTAGKAT